MEHFVNVGAESIIVDLTVGLSILVNNLFQLRLVESKVESANAGSELYKHTVIIVRIYVTDILNINKKGTYTGFTHISFSQFVKVNEELLYSDPVFQDECLHSPLDIKFDV